MWVLPSPLPKCGAALTTRADDLRRATFWLCAMILGIGSDLANIERIQGVLTRHGDRFRRRVFTDIELAKAARRRDEAGTLAKRWAAKEACSKALGTGLAMGISWRDMAVSNLPTGQPVMSLTRRSRYRTVFAWTKSSRAVASRECPTLR